MRTLKCVAAGVMLTLLAVTVSAQGPENINADADLETAAQVKDYYADWLSSIPGVSGVTVGNSDRGQPEIVVHVGQMTPQLKQIPETLNGIPVVIARPPQAEGGSLDASESLGARGYLPSPTPELEISPVPTPQGNKFWPEHPSRKGHSCREAPMSRLYGIGQCPLGSPLYHH